MNGTRYVLAVLAAAVVAAETVLDLGVLENKGKPKHLQVDFVVPEDIKETVAKFTSIMEKSGTKVEEATQTAQSVVDDVWSKQKDQLDEFVHDNASGIVLRELKGEICEQANDCSGAPYALCHGGLCAHKEVFPVLNSELAGIVILPLLLGLANIGGIGGGGLIIPIMIALFGFSTRESIAISNSTIFLGSVARFFLFSLKQRHPDKDATIIEYSLASVMIPVVLAGSYIGVLMNVILPEIVLTIILTLLLCYLTYTSFSKAIQLFKKETVQKKNEKEEYPELRSGGNSASSRNETGYNSPDKKEPLIGEGSGYSPAVNSEKTPDQRNTSSEAGQYIGDASFAEKVDPTLVGKKKQLDAILHREKSNLAQYKTHLIAFSLVMTSLMVNLIRGSPKTESIVGLEKCGVADWSIFTAFFVLVLVVSFLQIRRIKKEQALKEEVGGGLCASDLPFKGKTLTYLLIGSFCGGMAGALGLGGGVVFNPLLIGMGVPPTVATSTGMYMILFSSFASSLVFITFGGLTIDYAIWIGIWSVVGIIIGLKVIANIIKKYNRPSIVVFVLATVLFVSSIMVPIFNAKNLVKQIDLGKDIWKFGEMC